MKYLEVEVEGASKQGGLRLRGDAEGIKAKLSDEQQETKRAS